MVACTGNKIWRAIVQYGGGAVVGVLVFVGAPEMVRWLNGGAFAQNPAQQLPSASVPLRPPAATPPPVDSDKTGTNPPPRSECHSTICSRGHHTTFESNIIW